MNITEMIKECKEKHLLCFDEPKQVTELLAKVNEALSDYQVGIKPNENKGHKSWEEIEIVIIGKNEKIAKNGLFTDRIHVQSDIKKTFAHLFLYKTTDGLYI